MLLTIVAGLLGFIAIAGLGLAFAGQDASRAKVVKRASVVVGRGDGREGRGRRNTQNTQEQRRKQIIDTLREEERRTKKARVNNAALLRQAGLSDDLRLFWVGSIVLGLLGFGLTLGMGQHWLIALGAGFGAGAGLPRWIVGMLAARRTKKFSEAFPDALDVITRGIKSGLPVNDSLRMIGQEAPEPLAGEFKRLTENLQMGAGMDQAMEQMFQRMPTPEVRFFAIVLAIQQKTGGNLAEALGNLSSVIRARKLMREKVKAMSGEAVASAFIIGSLPPGVVALISTTSPAYMQPLFTDPRGKMIMVAGIVWMAIGIFVMRRMINFKI